jgi:uncharacterized membrane protein
MALELVVWVSGQAGEASRALQVLKKQYEPTARNTAVLIRDRDGQVLLFETGDVDLQHGPLLGVIVSLLMALLGSSAPDLAVAQTVSLGFPENYWTALPKLQPGGSALVSLVTLERAEETLDLLAEYRGEVWQQVLADDLLAQFSV